MSWPIWILRIAERIYRAGDDYFSADEREQLRAHEALLLNRQKEIEGLKEQVNQVIKSNVTYVRTIEMLEEDLRLKDNKIWALEEELKEGPLKVYWDNKIKPLKSFFYSARGKGVNVLDFFNKNNDQVRALSGKNNDSIANNCLKWVKANLTYVGDKYTKWKRNEWWQFANETLSNWYIKKNNEIIWVAESFSKPKEYPSSFRAGDCEDGAILMANMLRSSGIPEFRIRLNAGDVQGGGHAYVTYLREKDNQWYVLDWCYWYSQSYNFKKKWTEAKKYFGIWWSWNPYAVYKKAELDRK